LIKLFNHYFDRRTLLQMFMDLLLISAAFMATLVFLSDAEDLTAVQIGQGLFRALLMSMGFLAVNSALGLYERGSVFNNTQLRARVLVSFMMMGLIVVGVLLLLPMKAFYGHTWAVVIVMMATGLLLVIQVLTGEFLPKSLTRRKVLVYGTGAKAQAVGQSLLKASSSAELCGYFASPNEREHLVTNWGTLQPGQSLTEVVAEKGVHEIVIALSERRGGSMPMRELLDCKLAGVRVTDIATYFEQNLGQIRLDAVSAGWLIFGEGFDQGFLRTTIKRLFDMAGAVVLILLALPIMLVAALVIKLESSGPILYKQERVGLNNKPFNVVKFRSMRTDAEKDGFPAGRRRATAASRAWAR